MFHMCKDEDGNDYGWAKVLEYIGVGWDPATIGGNCKGQFSMNFDGTDLVGFKENGI